MADRTSLVSVNDGDQLSEGYFNGIFTEITTNMMRRVDSASGLSTGSTSQVEVDSITFPAATFATTDTLLIIVQGFHDDANFGQGLIRVADGTNTFNTALYTLGNNGESGMIRVYITQNQGATTSLSSQVLHTDVGDSHAYNDLTATMIANFLSAEITISLRGIVNVGGTNYFKWAIYKIPMA